MRTAAIYAFLLHASAAGLRTGNPCADIDENCISWSRLGQCEMNPAFMRAQCELSCGSCRANAPKESLAPDTHNAPKTRTPTADEVKLPLEAPELSRPRVEVNKPIADENNATELQGDLNKFLPDDDNDEPKLHEKNLEGEEVDFIPKNVEEYAEKIRNYASADSSSASKITHGEGGVPGTPGTPGKRGRGDLMGSKGKEGKKGELGKRIDSDGSRMRASLLRPTPTRSQRGSEVQIRLKPKVRIHV